MMVYILILKLLIDRCVRKTLIEDSRAHRFAVSVRRMSGLMAAVGRWFENQRWQLLVVLAWVELKSECFLTASPSPVSVFLWYTFLSLWFCPLVGKPTGLVDCFSLAVNFAQTQSCSQQTSFHTAYSLPSSMSRCSIVVLRPSLVTREVCHLNPPSSRPELPRWNVAVSPTYIARAPLRRCWAQQSRIASW